MDKIKLTEDRSIPPWWLDLTTCVWCLHLSNFMLHKSENRYNDSDNVLKLKNESMKSFYVGRKEYKKKNRNEKWSKLNWKEIKWKVNQAPRLRFIRVLRRWSKHDARKESLFLWPLSCGNDSKYKFLCFNFKKRLLYGKKYRTFSVRRNEPPKIIIPGPYLCWFLGSWGYCCVL